MGAGALAIFILRLGRVRSAFGARRGRFRVTRRLFGKAAQCLLSARKASAESRQAPS
jgi:hypothetical protein